MFTFTKMHGLGNDYVYVDCFKHDLSRCDLAALTRAISDRHRGVGSDGLILICPPRPGVSADARMEMYNADGSRGEMCGNGVRCVAKYVIDHGVAAGAREGDARLLKIETDRGVLGLTCYMEAGKVARVRVNMGAPILDPQRIPVKCEGKRCVKHETVQLVGMEPTKLSITCVSMGNPHAVSFMNSISWFELSHIGPIIETHRAFPKRVNYHIAEVLSRTEVKMRTWERGTGLTQACGTGACAVLVAGVLENRLDRRAMIHLPGGDLEIEWAGSGDDGDVFMTGPATEVFSGQWDETRTG